MTVTGVLSRYFLLITTINAWISQMVLAQVCSPPGQLCKSTSDCCRGCCEQYTCVERPFSCSPDLVAQPGSSSCRNYACPINEICYLRVVCPPENPCPKMPFCRQVPPTITKENRTEHSGVGMVYEKSRSIVLITLCAVLASLAANCDFRFTNDCTTV